MQETLRFMTKLDRAILQEEQLQQLSQFYRSENISPMDLFKLLRDVSWHSFNRIELRITKISRILFIACNRQLPVVANLLWIVFGKGCLDLAWSILNYVNFRILAY